MLTLGISGGFHAPAATLIEDGRIVAALEAGTCESDAIVGSAHRPGRVWPTQCVTWCLERRGASLSDVDHIAFAWDPALITDAHKGPPASAQEAAEDSDEREPLWATLPLCELEWVRRAIGKREAVAGVRAAGQPQWHYVPHQLSHIAAAFLTSPFEESAILCINARGERSGTSYAIGQGATIETLGEAEAAQSLGLLFERLTTHLGFSPGTGEDKVVALAARGKPRLREAFSRIVTRGQGRDYQVSNESLTDLLGPARIPGTMIETRHEDIACSWQECLAETVVGLADWLKRETRARHLTAAGGVFRNAVLNSALRDSGLFEKSWISPVAGAPGTALGAALWLDQTLRAPSKRESVRDTCWGPRFSAEEIETVLVRARLPYGRPPAMTVAVAARLASGKTVGWFQGAMEFGSQALGSRLILAAPSAPSMAETLNDLAGRDRFEPVACAVPSDVATDWFEDTRSASFRAFLARVRSDKRPRIPAAVHIDGTARVQTVERTVQPLFHDALEAFGALTGIPVLLSADFTTRLGARIRTPVDAIEAFASGPLDALAIGPFLLEKGR